MFGKDGWCQACGVPKAAQSGALSLQRKGMDGVSGAWVPHWRYDTICLDPALADRLAQDFAVALRPVDWQPPDSRREAVQLIVPTVGESWFDVDALRTAASARHGRPGATCSVCEVWRWLPVPFGELPPLRPETALKDVVVAGSPEWFGDGHKAFRQVLMKRALAVQLAAASPRDFTIREVQ